ncbi:MAG: TonB-dependent receptor [Pseudomonadales bacterium]|nr:TonB-dependent receptor [Pseudomonadales bacterium]
MNINEGRMTVMQKPAASRFGGPGFKPALLGKLSAAMLAVMTAPVLAQNSVISEIVITATKREQNLQDVSTAVTAIGGDRLDSAQVHDLEDLQQLVPGITIGNDFNMAKIFVRGVGANTSTTGSETGVAFHVDGAVVARGEAQLTSLFDVERIEVLRGPQGTLFGRNTTGGAINVITGKPTQEFEGYARVTGGRFDQIFTEGAVSGPLTDDGTLLGRIAFKTQDRDGFGENPVTGSEVDNLERRMARAHLQYTPSDRLDFLLTGEYFRQDDASGALKFQREAFPGVPQLFFLGEGGVATRRRDIAGEFDPSTDTRTWALTGTTNFQLTDNFSITNILNYRDFETSITQDLDLSAVVNSLGTTGQNTTVQRRDIDSEQFSTEFQFKYQNDWLDGIFGIFYFNEDQQPVDTVGLGPRLGQPVVLDTLANLPVFPPIGPTGLEVDSAFVTPSGAFDTAHALDLCNIANRENSLGNIELAPKRVCVKTNLNTDSLALFSQWRVNMGKFINGLDSVTLKLGGRYTTEKRKSANASLVVARNGLGPVISQTFEGSRNEDTFNDFTPEIGLEWQATSDMMLYYTYSEGFKAGAGENSTSVVSTDPSSPDFARSIIVAPETIENNEFGLKSTWFDNRLIVNASGFFYELEGLQINKTVAGGAQGFSTIFENAARVKARGFELEFLSQPLDWVRFSGSVAYLHSRFKDFLTADPLDPRNVDLPGPNDLFVATNPEVQLAGNKTRNSPDWAGNLHGEIDIPGLSLPGDGTLTLGADGSYKSAIFFTEFNREVEGSKDYIMTDLNLTYTSGSEKLTAEFWVKNVANTFRATSSFQLATARVIGVTFLDPRTYGFTLGYRF